MIVERLELVDFRNYHRAELGLAPGTTAVLGDNGQGKTNLAEALAYLAGLDSFRGAPADALVRVGAEQAVVRATIVQAGERRVLVEAEINRQGRNRVLVNRQRLVRSRDLLGVVRVTVFSPDDLGLVKEGPARRRRFLDELLVGLQVKHDLLRTELDRILRQRNTLLKQAGGRLTDDIVTTLDVWDAKLTTTGEELGRLRAELVSTIAPMVGRAYRDLAGDPVDSCGQRAGVGEPILLAYEPRWRRTGLAAALAGARTEDVRRQVSTVGPHRDELNLFVGELPARTHASQGEQRTLALGLRLAGHRMITERVGTPPVLVLDDVLSELDAGRARALLDHLPAGQVLITTAGTLPPGPTYDEVVRIVGGEVTVE